jgi:methyl acetate hydrolase
MTSYSATLRQALDPVLQRGVDEGIPGIVAALTTPAGDIYTGAFGRRGLDAETPMTPDTVFRIASMTKAIVGFAVMQLVDRGRLDLDAPAGAIVPYLGEVLVLAGFSETGEPLLRPPVTPVTLRHLLTHTSGFAYDTWCVAQRRYTDAIGFKPQGRERLRTPLMFEPGTSWQYSIGYDWAAIVLEAVTGQRLGDYAREQIFGPLGMEASWVVRGERRNRMARNHQRGPDGVLALDPNEPPEELDYEPGGGGLFTTAPDYMKFIRLILNRGEGNGVRLISEPAFDELVRPDASPGNAVTPLVSTDFSRSMEGEFFPGVPKRHSLGFVVNDAIAPTGRSPGSLCWGGFFNTYYWIDPTRQLGGVFLTQIVPFLDPHALRVFDAFETAAYRALG